MHNNSQPDGTTRLCICGTRGSRNPTCPQATEESSTRTRSTRPSALTIPTSIRAPLGRSHGTCHGHRWQRASHRQTGVAPAADLIFVHIYGGDREGGVLGNSRTLLEAVDYIFTKAAELGKSAVVNLSLGTHGGPHDGSTLAEQGFDFVEGARRRSTAGNSWEHSHASRQLEPGESRILGWSIQPGD